MGLLNTGTATVTGKIGPGNTLTSFVVSGITQFDFDIQNNLFKYSIQGTWNQIDISAATTVTITLSAAAGNYTITIS
jgi:hypothetical protein